MNRAVDRAAALRRFHRFWMQLAGALGERSSASPFSLAQLRVLYEIAHHGPVSAAVLCRTLGLDGGYLSRILRGFEQHGLVVRAPDPADRRRSTLRLTDAGADAFAMQEAGLIARMSGLLQPLPAWEQDALIAALGTAEALLGPRPDTPLPDWRLRPHGPGDLGWVISRHGALYVQEHGWDPMFEAEVAGIAARFLAGFDAQRERGWIAERNGARLGSVFLVRRSDELAQLRLLLVEPAARGLGIARRLVSECIAFAGEAGYRRLMLETVSVLAAARALYASAGFRMTAAQPARAYGQDLIAEIWELPLRSGPRRIGEAADA
jgi:DNA-binding MarR family transcriptional regulator/GNAT superfamily N-acetyltransferase